MWSSTRKTLIVGELVKIMLATLVLNEIEWLDALWRQHKRWPNVAAWVFVEAADCRYAEANPDLVSADGLSVDGTTGWLAARAGVDRRVHHYPMGVMGEDDEPAQGKCSARNVYMLAAEEIKPDWIVVLDADEFYTQEDQRRITDTLTDPSPARSSILLRQRYPWRPPSCSDRPLFEREVVGGYWSVPHLRIWPWRTGLRYWRNHNTMEHKDGSGPRDHMLRLDQGLTSPQCVHTAFASDVESRKAKHRYYQRRGEGPQDGRQRYVDCRAAWETWEEGDELPQGARVLPYDGPVPEVFR